MSVAKICLTPKRCPKRRGSPSNLKKGLTLFVAVLVITSLLVSCGKPKQEGLVFFEHPDPTVQQVLQRALAAAGSLQLYQGLDSIKYVKRSVLYNGDGEVESDVRQSHAYSLQPQLSGSISWQVDSVRHLIRYENGTGVKFVEGEQIEDQGAASRSFLSAYYVLFMPFKLADEGVVLSYDGKVKLDSGLEVDAIKATYDPSENSNHSTSDVWWYYFDAKDGKYLACMVHHPPTYAYIENNSKEVVSGISMNTYRKSWRTDSLRNKQFLRGEFWYDDYQLK